MPVEFVRKYLNQCSEDILLHAHNEKQKWPAKCSFRFRDGSSLIKKIGQGWAPFSESKNLKEGDVCVFELINNKVKEILLKVHIFRAVDYAEPLAKRFKAK